MGRSIVSLLSPRLGGQDFHVLRRLLSQGFKTRHAGQNQGCRAGRRFDQSRRRSFRARFFQRDSLRRELFAVFSAPQQNFEAHPYLSLVVNLQICILALGSTYNFPFRSNSSSLADAKAALVEAQLALKDTQRDIVIVGGGPVGVEYAGGAYYYCFIVLSDVQQRVFLIPFALLPFFPRNHLSAPRQEHHHPTSFEPISRSSSTYQTVRRSPTAA